MWKNLPKWARHLLILLVLIVASKAAWGMVYPSGEWRYKLTVEIETPEGVKTGSTVRQVPRLLGEAYSLHMGMPKGEAVVIDLGQRGVVFALNPTYKHGGKGAYVIVQEAFPKAYTGQADIIRHYSRLEGGPVDVPVASYPVFVRFRDPLDPKTVESLLEYKTCADEKNNHDSTICLKNDRFAEVFGESVSLKSVTIEMTRVSVTTGVVERYLPWIYSLKSNLDGTSFTSSRELSNTLDWGAFVRGKK